MSIYGIAPFFLQMEFNLKEFLSGIITIVFISLVLWTINIGLFNLKKYSIFKFKFYVSYLITFVIIVVMIFFSKWFDMQPKDNILYPVFITLALNTIILIILYSITTGEKKQIAENEIQKLQIKNMEARQLLLMQQLQPHFLFNALSALKSLINTSPEKAENYTIQLSEFLRYSVNSHNSSVVTLEQELNFTQNYINLQKVRFGDALEFVQNIDKALYNIKIPAFTLQLLVENAIKHNSFSNRNPLKIEIESNKNVILVANNKIEASNENIGGVGLSNLKERYKSIVGNEIEIIDNENSFKVYLTLTK
jgi:LytS/YehU family sensor histidine kinase